MPVLSLSVALGLGPLAVWVGAIGTTRYVDDNTCPATGSGTLADPFCRIRDAICAAVSGDTVSVAPGTYNESLRMKPGVSLVSEGGPSVTTINGAGQPCTNTDYCTQNAGNQCSVVIFPAGHTLSTSLDGFTITGGQGAILSASIAGGGIYVFSSPTITNNVITSNVMAGSRTIFTGAGIHVEVGSPLITGNTISGNRANPAAGIYGAPTFGYGGGIYVTFNTSPTITNNIIAGNTAGDPNVAFSVGSGGGLSLWPGDANHPDPIVLDRNTVVDNQADTMGGGIATSSLVNTQSQAIVSNNVIVGNKAPYGGGVYLYFSSSKTVNNTIVDNEAKFGGGVYSGQSDVSLPIVISNNIIFGNRLGLGGNGGGIYTLDFSPSFDPTIEANDFFDNQKNQIAGDRDDANTIGVGGNFLGDPNFVDRAARDFHLTPGSPAIDVAYAIWAPAVDRDNLARGFDGTGTPNSPQPGDNDVGAYEWYPPCVPVTETCNGLDDDCDTQIDEGNPGGGLTCSTGLPGVCSAGTTVCQSSQIACVQNLQASSEVCDNLDNDCDGTTDEGNPGGGVPCSTGLPGVCSAGTLTCQAGSLSCVENVPSSTEVCDDLDNDCDGTTDEGFSNLDGDAMADCVDPDDDNDGAMDGSDCLPLDSTAFGSPGEVMNVTVTNSPATTVAYATQNIGSGTRYQIVSGLMTRLRITQTFSEDFCVAASYPGGPWQDSRPNPPSRDGWFYMIRAVNACGSGTFGGPLIDQPRPANACPSGIVDADIDGSPSDLDCNDADPDVSPLVVEMCDGQDNNCLNGIDEGNPGGGLICGSSVGECRTGTTQCQGGSIACAGGVQPSTESCDGLDNDCDGVPDDGFPDTDGDTLDDCADLDDDNDGALDAADCAPLDPGAFGIPIEVQTVNVLGAGPTQVSWADQTMGAATLYEIATGSITSTGHVTFSAGTCLGTASGSPATDSRPGPSSGQAFYYMVKSRNVCGPGTYGTVTRDTQPSCP